MSDAMMTARVEAICEIQAAMFKAAGGAFQRHGNDPHGLVVMLAATAMFVNKIDEHINPGFRGKVIEVLKRGSDKEPKSR